RENGLSVAVMPEFRHRRRHLFQVALFRLAINAHESVRLGKREAAQEKALNQTNNGGVRANPEREWEHSDDSEPRRFAELAQREAGKDREKKTEQTLCAPGFVDPVDHWPRVVHGLRWIDRTDRVPNRFGK